MVTDILTSIGRDDCKLDIVDVYHVTTVANRRRRFVVCLPTAVMVVVVVVIVTGVVGLLVHQPVCFRA